MPVPPEIRAVPRPKNTIVEDRGREGPKRYAVRARGAIKWIPGKNPQPHNGKVIGHIINGKFVALANKENNQNLIPDMLSYGSAALIKSVSDDLLSDLLKVYDPVEAYTLHFALKIGLLLSSIKILHNVILFHTQLGILAQEVLGFCFVAQLDDQIYDSHLHIH